MLPVLLATLPAAAVSLDTPEQAARVVAAGALVVDTRSTVDFVWGHVPGAVSVGWRIGVVGGLRSGLLGAPDTVAAAFGALGVRAERPVLVVGAWTAGWGEEGRIAWDLEYLGHPDVHVLRGGMAAWTGAVERGTTTPVPATFTAHVRPELRADRAAVKAAGVLVDVREADEYAGSNGYLAAYGGHVPGAVSVPWRTIADGAPVPGGEGTTVVYCTGGVRSAFVWLLLAAQGRSVANYDGGWWDWAAHEAEPASAP